MDIWVYVPMFKEDKRVYLSLVKKITRFVVDKQIYDSTPVHYSKKPTAQKSSAGNLLLFNNLTTIFRYFYGIGLNTKNIVVFSTFSKFLADNDLRDLSFHFVDIWGIWSKRSFTLSVVVTCCYSGDQKIDFFIYYFFDFTFFDFGRAVGYANRPATKSDNESKLFGYN